MSVTAERSDEKESEKRVLAVAGGFVSAVGRMTDSAFDNEGVENDALLMKPR